MFILSAYLCAVIKRIIAMQKESPILEQQRPDRQYYSRQNRIKRELDHAVTLLKAAFASWVILTIVCAFIGCAGKQVVLFLLLNPFALIFQLLILDPRR